MVNFMQRFWIVDVALLVILGGCRDKEPAEAAHSGRGWSSKCSQVRKTVRALEVASVLGQLCNDPETRLWLNMSPPCKTRSGHSRLHPRQPDYRKLPGCPVFALGVGLGRAFCLKGLRI